MYDKKTTTMRRFKEFEKLVSYLRTLDKLKGIPIPELKKQKKAANAKVISERQDLLEFVMNDLLKREEIRNLIEIRQFLLTEEPLEEFEQIPVLSQIKNILPAIDLRNGIFSGLKAKYQSPDQDIS
jgi:PX domain